ncbi:DUF4439 domain-containing protein [Brachybacterium halotolerans subsp. kimchii]|uniref:DUF4439 domain-containing protein n=1 Tax=Brachybacterium halotolerans TaxID=2795215 RepID=A0ABS1BDF3_9MICO|nr:DUF4439 domain-containing protein [Brachybacterium halotolerans]MBK0332683.1 DUF4439 domain-containing protein [Brachybacterium halotolerans]UEJ83712.1 DUF4439 domain-containing protein [Brachybacterium halotolerans subsp. kimchii]
MRAELPHPGPRRRAVLLGGLSLGALALSGCDGVRIGQPAVYTPPPEGIDDLYRRDLLALLETGLGAQIEADERSRGLVTGVQEALGRQREAMLTGAEAEDESSASSDGGGSGDSGGSGGTGSSDGGGTGNGGGGDAAPTDLQGLSDLLVAIRDLTTDAARQVSGSLARPMLATGVFSAWAAQRLARIGGTKAPTRPPSAEKIVPTRDVPESDPPSIGAEVDYHSSLERAQEDEWYAGYVREVLAASASGTQRSALIAQSDADRERAEQLGAFAREDGAKEVLRAAVYPLPGGGVTQELRKDEPEALALTLVEDHVILTGAAPFERRSLSIAAALDQAVLLASLRSSLSALPTLDPEG